MPTLVRLVVLDYYMSSPVAGLDVTYSEFRGSAVSQVPILRCFGSNETGKKICVHIHGVFPYFYIPYDGTGRPEELMYQLASALDKAINISFNQASSNTQHVYKIVLISGIPMYGYHSKKHQFFKIYLYNPKLIAKAGALLLNKQVLEQSFQPHEIHLNFTLQFMIDYNLHGMSNMLISEMKYRLNADGNGCDIADNLLLPAHVKRTSVCELEADVNAENILNRQEILSGNLAANPGIAAIWEDEKQRRRDKNQESQLGDFLELKNMITEPTRIHLIFQQALRDRLAVLSTQVPLNDSIYPAETPDDSKLQNASFIDIHSSSSLELSLDDTLNMSCSQNFDETLKPSGSDSFSGTMDDDAKEFLNLLEQLAGEKISQQDNEDISILSQVVPDYQIDESAEDFLDLSMPLASLTTPKKLEPKPQCDSSDDDTNYFNATVVPQLDGQCSDCDIGKSYFSRRFKRRETILVKRTCGRSMPLLDNSDVKKDNFSSLFNLVPYVMLERLDIINKPLTAVRKKIRRSSEEIIEEKLRLIRSRINRIYVKRQLKRIGDKMRRKERTIQSLLDGAIQRARFKVKPAHKWFLDPPQIVDSNGTILNRFLCLTNNYSDPELHLILTTPLATFLFYYGGSCLPEVFEVSSSPLPDEQIKIYYNQITRTKTCNAAYLRKKLAFLQKQILFPIPRRRQQRQPVWTKTLDIDDPPIVKDNKLSDFMLLKCNAELFNEAQKASAILQDHVRHLKEFDLGVSLVTQSGRSKELANIVCLKSDVIDESDSALSEESNFESHPSSLKRSLSRDSDYASLFGKASTTQSVLDVSDNEFFEEEPFVNGLGNTVIGKRKLSPQSTANMLYINCDGALDTSSEDEENEKVSKGKRVKKKLRSCQYTPLGITIKSSPNLQGVAVNRVELSGDRQHLQETTSSVTQSNNNFRHKRKLLFENANTLSQTITEHFTECNYSPFRSKSQDVDNKESIVRLNSTEAPNSSTLKAASSDSDMFSDNEDPNQSFFKGYNVSVSEKYDLENKYVAKEGCSTIFSSGSLPPAVRSSAETIVSDIPPYQANKTTDINNIKPIRKAPSRLQVETSLSKYKLPKVLQQEPFYGDTHDYTGVVEVGHRVMKISSKTTAHLSEFESQFDGLNKFRRKFIEQINLTWNTNNVKSLKLSHCGNKQVIIQPVKKPPTVKQVERWLEAIAKPLAKQNESDTFKQRKKIYIPNSQGESDLDLSLSSSNSEPNSPVLGHLTDSFNNKSCQISGLTQQNSFGFDHSVQNLQAVRAVAEHQHLTTMIMELHVRTRADLQPDPQFDAICAIFYSILNDIAEISSKRTRGVIAVSKLPADLGTSRPDLLNGIGSDCDINLVETEEDLINTFVCLLNRFDPDIVAGYEIEMSSWGYLVERAFVLSINILPLLGRSELHKYGKTKLKTITTDLESNIIGRIVLDVWRLMRHEIPLQSYTFESIVYHILHRRVPKYFHKDLTFWWDHRSNLYRHRVVRYYIERVETILELFDKLDFLNRTSELAKLFGILFYEVLSRGSQFRVESMMLRLAKPLNYVPVSPDVKQRAHMKAPEYIALVMEPESKLYSDPVIVLDFQSLYPSIIIAYNYCFTTCIGRVNNLGTDVPFEFGATQLKVPKNLVEKLCKRELLNYSPCGVAFVKQKVREGILPRMLKEVLDTRLMVKNSMKENKGNDNLQKVLHNRQLGLKLIANVTYGYTAANFSGRMCCVEVGDSVVSKGRETLQRAIALVENTMEWEAKVVYGDTDSLFVLVPGKTKEEAFEVGKKIADAITADNPDPVKLKLEKVYQPCILQTKKRYVGYMYESPDQKEPIYEAKGIETVRRDGCPAVAKMLQKCLTLLFETKNVSLIKSYVLKQFNKIQTGRASIQDLTFAKEYRGASGYKPGACVPALELAKKWKAVDRRREPRSGERVPYVIINGPPGLPLIRLVKSPQELLNDNSLRPNALYYITKVIIPPINRCFNLIGADLNIWFNQMPRKNTQYLPNSSPSIKSTISQYFVTKICACCTEPTQDGLCVKCCCKANVSALILTEKLRKWEENYNNSILICQSCTGCLDEITCSSLDCPVLYRRKQTLNDLQQSDYVRDILSTNNVFLERNFFE